MGTVYHFAGPNELAYISLAGCPENDPRRVHRIRYGYDRTPRSGSLTIVRGGTLIQQVPVLTDGPLDLELARPLPIKEGPYLIVLSAGGDAVTGSLGLHLEA